MIIYLNYNDNNKSDIKEFIILEFQGKIDNDADSLDFLKLGTIQNIGNQVKIFK